MSNANVEKLLKEIKGGEIIDVDFRFTDPRGTWHHMTFHTDGVSKDILENGIPFDGSSIPGWKPIENSDMVLRPDLTRTFMDPFTQNETLVVICDVWDPQTKKLYNRDPRTTAQKAETYLKSTGLADQAFFGPEPEFFIFDRVAFDSRENFAFHHLISDESNTSHSPHLNAMEGLRCMGHRPNAGKGYAPVAPIDRLGDLRSDMLVVLKEMGLGISKHHHEVASAQHELGFDYATLLETADNLQIFKYAIHNMAHHHDKTATFMPKPIYGDNGSGMHVHQSLWKSKTPLFLGKSYDDLSDLALYYIGGILKHAKALNAFTNPTTNSYKRLVPGFEAPVYRAYSAMNRSAAIRIPYSAEPKAKRIEVRFPDPAANPYLALSAMLMAGLDGIENKINPGKAMDQNLYEADPLTLGDDIFMAGSLNEALEALAQDHAFLLKGDVFTKDQIQAYIELKQEELDYINQCPTPAEFKLYYSA